MKDKTLKTLTDSSQSIQPAQTWTPQSWRLKKAWQQPVYDDPRQVESCLDELRRKPPLVAQGEVDRLRSVLADAVEGKRFVLHGGDCAERFMDCTGPMLTSKLKILLQMSLVLTYATRKSVIRIGRLAGQYAKPRSNDYEELENRRLPVYRGDLINDASLDEKARRPDPNRMIDGYHHAAAGLNFIRALIEGGFADLHHPELWNLAFLDSSPHRQAYRKIIDAINDSIAFMETISRSDESLRRVEFYTSHEALLLPFEESLTRCDSNDDFYNLSAHFLWLGYRTAQLDGAHVEYLRGIRNPIGVKIGPLMPYEHILELIEILDPHKQPGRLALITRIGAAQVESYLPKLVDGVQKTGRPVLWGCDPMHGNTEITRDGRKTRRMESIFSELEQTFAIHEKKGTCLSGIHFELTSDAVTECIGGSSGVTEDDLSLCYETACDPRLNGAQALELAFLITRLLR
ncbi:MAG: 3-deoxy-7-phosphoheptulonate synthase class II [Candidatus Hinthialibacter sp.]